MNKEVEYMLEIIKKLEEMNYWLDKHNIEVKQY